MNKGLAFDPERREERFRHMLDMTQRGIRIGDLQSRLRQAEAFSNGDIHGYAPQSPQEIMADVLSLLKYVGTKW